MFYIISPYFMNECSIRKFVHEIHQYILHSTGYRPASQLMSGLIVYILYYTIYNIQCINPHCTVSWLYHEPSGCHPQFKEA